MFKIHARNPEALWVRVLMEMTGQAKASREAVGYWQSGHRDGMARQRNLLRNIIPPLTLDHIADVLNGSMHPEYADQLRLLAHEMREPKDSPYHVDVADRQLD